MHCKKVSLASTRQPTSISKTSSYDVLEDTEEFWADVQRTDEDEVDKGGEEGLAATSDKSRLRTRRSIELLLTSGRVVRFEVSRVITAFTHTLTFKL